MRELEARERRLGSRSSDFKTAWGGLIIGSALIASIVGIAWSGSDWGRGIFSHLCHQQTGRCIAVGGTAMAVCARCLGIYVGIVVGCAFHALRYSRFKVSSTWLWINLLGAACTNGLDVLLEAWQAYGNLPILRLALGLYLGVSLALFVLGRVTTPSPKENNRASNRLPSGVG
jgi:uncharacterized membrane protein